jgi:DNA-binding response OmpR family regulator
MTEHLLLVDDDVLLRCSLSFNLERAGYRASTAATAKDAMALARREPPDLILLDIGLPGMDGLEALRHFEESIDVPPVIFLTARRRELDLLVRETKKTRSNAKRCDNLPKGKLTVW